MSIEKLKYPGPCSPPPEQKKEMALGKTDTGDYALEYLIDGQPRAVALLTPAEAESLALQILADIQKNRQ